MRELSKTVEVLIPSVDTPVCHSPVPLSHLLDKHITDRVKVFCRTPTVMDLDGFDRIAFTFAQVDCE
jgi:hypothetical protein